MKRNLRTTLDLIHPLQSLNQTVQQTIVKQKKNYDTHTISRKIHVGNRVLVRNYRNKTKWIAGKVIKQMGAVPF